MSEPYRMAPEDFKRYVTSACRAGNWQNLADLIVQYTDGLTIVPADTRRLAEAARSLHLALSNILRISIVEGEQGMIILNTGYQTLTAASAVLSEYGVLETEPLDKPECLTDEDNA